MLNEFEYGYVWDNDEMKFRMYGYKVSPLLKFLPKKVINRMKAEQAARAQCKINGPEDRNNLIPFEELTRMKNKKKGEML